MAGQEDIPALPVNGRLQTKRQRAQLSCNACRQGKLKCNRDHPACDQCVKRNRDDSCTYPPPPRKSRANQSVKGRIHQLEQLVVDLMRSKDSRIRSETSPSSQNVETSAPSTDSSSARASFSQLTPPHDSDDGRQLILPATESTMAANEGALGQLKISKNETSYVGGSHWTAILDSITDLKKDLNDEADSDDWKDQDEVDLEQADPIGMSFLLRSPRRMTKSELLRALPPRSDIDKLLYQFFNAADPFKAVLHPPTFQEEYKQFWKDPTKTPTMWLGLLFAIMSLASAFALREGIDPRAPEGRAALTNSTKFHEYAASAAALADYTAPKAYTIEYLILYAGGLRTKQTFVDLWLVLGLAVRLALRMGYHRDPSHYDTTRRITPFQGEMRRRVWHMLYMIDILISFGVGLPSSIRAVQSDCQIPRNLLDQDLSARCKELPPSRPLEELTPVTYGIVKARFTGIFGNAAELSHATIPPAYTEILDLDKQLEHARSMLPSGLRVVSFDQCITDSPETIMWRFNLELLYLKIKCVLHRRFMHLENASDDMSYSRKICVESALKTLHLQHGISAATQPGGQLEKVRWYMGSISANDFLLAAMILCLDLSHQCGPMAESRQSSQIQHADVVDALEKTRKIWEEAESPNIPDGSSLSQNDGQNEFSDPKKASKALAAMLVNVKGRHASAVDPSVANEEGAYSSVFPRAASAASDPYPQGTFNVDTSNIDVGMGDYTMFGDMLDIPDNINWELWDQHIAGQADATQYVDWSLDDIMDTSNLQSDLMDPTSNLMMAT